ncbi:DUF4350 domain-containing protein [Virgibacillus kimchii]
MQSSQTTKRTWIWLAVILLLFIVISYFLISQQPEEFPGYVSESPSPTGTKAFYTYLEENIEVDRWEHDPEMLPREDRGELLLMIEPFFVPDQSQMDEYIRYMEAGNTIMLFKNDPNDMFGLETEMHMMQLGEARTLNSGLGNEMYEAMFDTRVRMEDAPEDEVLLYDYSGAIALERSFGDGSLIAVNAPLWLVNEYITEEDHVELIFLLMQQADYSRILFDEYIHGAGSGPTVVTMYPQWMLVLALQLAVLTLLWLWYQGKRFGPVRTPREAEVRFSNERTIALAAWYQRSRRYQDSLKLQADYVKLLLQEKWGIPYRRSWQESTEMLKRKVEEMPVEDVSRFTLELTKLLNKESVNKQEYVAWSKKLDRLQREVEEE